MAEGTNRLAIWSPEAKKWLKGCLTLDLLTIKLLSDSFELRVVGHKTGNI